MKKRVLFISLLVCLTYTMSAQFNFVVQSGSESVFKTLNEAYDFASSGDTIYLPGGSFDLPTVDKPIVWIGVGYNPDSTAATLYTRVNNEATFTGNCDGSNISGIHFASPVVIGESGNDAVDIKISRCRFEKDATLKYNDGAERNINLSIRESIFDANINANLGTNVFINNSIIRGVIHNFRHSFLDRVILTYGARNSSSGYSYSFYNSQYCTITNSVFNIYSYSSWAIDIYTNTNNNFINCIFAGNVTFPQGTNTGTANLSGVDLLTVFEHIEGSIIDFSYLHDFHMKAGSPGIGTGLLGTDISIFSGSNTFKVGGLPSNPHISNINIGTETTNGLLHIEVTARAQNN